MNGDKMSSILEIGKNKTKCQKFTPSALVDTMLNLVNYNADLIVFQHELVGIALRNG